MAYFSLQITINHNLDSFSSSLPIEQKQGPQKEKEQEDLNEEKRKAMKILEGMFPTSGVYEKKSKEKPKYLRREC